MQIKVIHTRGSDFDMGKQHAEQVGNDFEKGMAHFYINFWNRLWQNKVDGFANQMGMKLAKLFIDQVVQRRLVSSIPENFLDRVEGMISGSALSLNDMLIALTLPDLYPVLQTIMVKLNPQSFLPVQLPKMGCSSFIYQGDKFLYGRNLDFPGVGYWDKYPVIQLTERKNCLRHIDFTTAGVPFGGITGINEAQISVSLHQHYGKNYDLTGVAPFVIGEEILDKAKTLNEAKDLIRARKIASCWAFLITDGKSKKGIIVEKSPKTMGIRQLDGTCLTHSNYFQSSECRPVDYSTTSRMTWDNFYRADRLKKELEKEGRQLKESRAVQLLSEHFDSYWGEEKVINRTVSQLYNIQSLLLDPVEMKAYVAEGTSPIQLHNYIGFDLNEILKGNQGRTSQVLPGFNFTQENKRAAKITYTQSFMSAFEGDWVEALRLAEKSLAEEFTPEIAQVTAVLFLKQNKMIQAVELLEKAMREIESKAKEKGLSHYPPEYFEIGIFYARALDMRGEVTQAKEVYRKLVARPDFEDSHLKKIAEKAKTYGKKQLSKLMMPYSSYVPFE